MQLCIQPLFNSMLTLLCINLLSVYRTSQPVTNALVDSACCPSGMATEPLRFPNLVTGTERNPAHAARAALYTRFTPYEWTQNSLNHYNESDTNRNFAERLRSDAVRVMR